MATDPENVERGDGADATTDSLSLQLFGSFELWQGPHLVVVQSAGQRILAGLALDGARSRTALVALLYPDIRERTALVRLRSALSRLRRQAPGALSEIGDRVSLGPNVSIDTRSMEVLAHDLLDDRIQLAPADLDMALARINTDDLLIGWFDEWVLLAGRGRQPGRSHGRVRRLTSAERVSR